jgi:hypothetical protein
LGEKKRDKSSHNNANTDDLRESNNGKKRFSQGKEINTSINECDKKRKYKKYPTITKRKILMKSDEKPKYNK